MSSATGVRLTLISIKLCVCGKQGQVLMSTKALTLLYVILILSLHGARVLTDVGFFLSCVSCGVSVFKATLTPMI